MKRAGIAVLDYGAGNLKSVGNALAHLGAEFFLTSDPDELLHASSMIFPGDGEAAATMSVLSKTGLGEAIKSFFATGKKILGICIGCQVIFERSEERDTPCLGLVKGVVRRFPRDAGLKVPHMGWNEVTFIHKPGIHQGDPGRFFILFRALVLSRPNGSGGGFWADGIWGCFSLRDHPRKSRGLPVSPREIGEGGASAPVQFPGLEAVGEAGDAGEADRRMP